MFNFSHHTLFDIVFVFRFSLFPFFPIKTKDIVLHCNTVRVSEKQIIKKSDGLANVRMYVVI